MPLVASLVFALAVTAPAAAPATDGAQTPVTMSAPTPMPLTSPTANRHETWAPRWEASVGYQRWGNEGFFSLGYRKQIHEVRLLGTLSYSIGPAAALNYRVTLMRHGRLGIHGGGLVRFPFRAGGHVGAAYRSGGEGLLGRTEWGLDAGAWCGTDRVGSDCGPMLGLYGGFYFDDSFFGGLY